jgi:c-di-GMP-related signal transduction protein
MEVYIARQAIFDRNLNVFGYELLFRSCQSNCFDSSVDGDTATRQLISNCFCTLGAEKILGGKRAFVNFTENLLLDGTPGILPSGSSVIEVLEDVKATPAVVAACDTYRRSGYMVALDDISSGSYRTDLLSHVDIGKVDYRTTEKFDRMFLARKLKKCGVKALAEKVESHQEFQEAVGLGYELFQGHFFEKPVLMSGKDPAGFKQNYLRILQEIHRPPVDFVRLEEIVKQEVTLTYKLLRYVNSAFYQKASRFESIQQALLIMGDEGVRKWLTLVAVPELAKGKPSELAVMAIQRARVCESLACLSGLEGRATDLFLLGMFSLLDALMDSPLETLLENLHIAEDVRSALLQAPDSSNPISNVYQLAVSLEKAEWPAVWETADRLSLKHEDVSEAYYAATQWADEIVRFSARP